MFARSARTCRQHADRAVRRDGVAAGPDAGGARRDRGSNGRNLPGPERLFRLSPAARNQVRVRASPFGLDDVRGPRRRRRLGPGVHPLPCEWLRSRQRPAARARANRRHRAGSGLRRGGHRGNRLPAAHRRARVPPPARVEVPADAARPDRDLRRHRGRGDLDSGVPAVSAERVRSHHGGPESVLADRRQRCGADVLRASREVQLPPDAGLARGWWRRRHLRGGLVPRHGQQLPVDRLERSIVADHHAAGHG